jgi:integrase
MSKDWNVTIGTGAGKPFVNVYFQKRRFRYWNGKSIGVKLKASENPELLRGAFELKMREGWRPSIRTIAKAPPAKRKTFIERLHTQLEVKQKLQYSYHYKRDCKWLINQWVAYAEEFGLINAYPEDLSLRVVQEFVKQPKWSARTQKNVLTYFKILSKDILSFNITGIKINRVKSELHKPIRNPIELLDDIHRFDSRLYLTCILTYGCLLRPHQEIRLLTWGDVDFNRRIISLSGKRNKSGRNRVVPMTQFVFDALQSFEVNKDPDHNILSSSPKPYNRDYISLLWSRYRLQSHCLDEGVTLYSWRHHSAIKVFEKTGSLQKLQQVMGHSSMTVSLTYLRGLEVQQLDVNDLPEL